VESVFAAAQGTALLEDTAHASDRQRLLSMLSLYTQQFGDGDEMGSERHGANNLNSSGEKCSEIELLLRNHELTMNTPADRVEDDHTRRMTSD
jgi:hypothetical protein